MFSWFKAPRVCMTLANGCARILVFNEVKQAWVVTHHTCLSPFSPEVDCLQLIDYFDRCGIKSPRCCIAIAGDAVVQKNIWVPGSAEDTSIMEYIHQQQIQLFPELDEPVHFDFQIKETRDQEVLVAVYITDAGWVESLFSSLKQVDALVLLPHVVAQYGVFSGLSEEVLSLSSPEIAEKHSGILRDQGIIVSSEEVGRQCENVMMAALWKQQLI